MEQEWATTVRRRKNESPPPPVEIYAEDELHWSLSIIRLVAGPLLCVMLDLYNSASLFSRVLIWQLSSIVVAMEYMQQSNPEPLLSALLAMIKMGLVGNCIAAVTLQLRRRAERIPMLGNLLFRTPLLVGSSTEIAMVLVVLNQKGAAATDSFFVGIMYAKLLFVGALCFIFYSIRPAQQRSSLSTANSSDVVQLLFVGGLMVLASAPRIQSRLEPSHLDQTNLCGR